MIKEKSANYISSNFCVYYYDGVYLHCLGVLGHQQFGKHNYSESGAQLAVAIPLLSPKQKYLLQMKKNILRKTEK